MCLSFYIDNFFFHFYFLFPQQCRTLHTSGIVLLLIKKRLAKVIFLCKPFLFVINMYGHRFP